LNYARGDGTLARGLRHFNGGGAVLSV